MANYSLEGAAELKAALKELTDMKSPDWKSTLRAAVRTPMTVVKRRAQVNLAAVSPGKAAQHRTYLGRIVTAGFASRSLRLVVKLNPKKGFVSATLGVLKEAFYALSFIELGTSSIPRHPWLTPAMEASKDSIIKDVGAAMRKRIDAIARRRNRKSGASK